MSETQKEITERCFRRLREKWFHNNLRKEAHERVWETEEQETQRERHNAAFKARYDADTEAILRGEDRPIAPQCEYDLDRHSG